VLVDQRDSWPKTPEEAIAQQDRLRAEVDLSDSVPDPVRTVAGLDVAYVEGTRRAVAAAVVMSYPELVIVDQSVVSVDVTFPYVPGLLAFREAPPLVTALRGLSITPDLLVCDGFGVAHPRRFGLACHLGVIVGLPSVGVGKSAFVGTYAQVGSERGAWSAIADRGEVVGRVLRTRTKVKPVYVSVGHRVELEHACQLVLDLCRGYRLPEPIRAADGLARQATRG
jgi:deoxyribonuclease V